MPQLPAPPRFLLALGLALAALTGCTGEDELPYNGGGGDYTPPPSSGGDPCASPAEGCPCKEPGSTAACGKVSEHYEDYVVCTTGTTVCDGSRWGACSVEGTKTRVRAGTNLGTLGLAPQPQDCMNACAPDCSTYTDTPSGLDAGAGTVVTDGGLTLEPVPATSNTTCTSLRVTPNTAPGKDIVVTNPAVPSTRKFTAELLPAGCYVGTIQPLWSIDRFDIAQIAADGTLEVITPIAGPIQVRAFVGSLTGQVTSNVSVAVSIPSTLNPPPSGVTAGSFPAPDGATPTDADLTLLYPYHRTVLPLGLLAPLVQWSNNSVAANSVLVTLRYPAGSATPIFSYSEYARESTTFPVPLLSAKPRARIPQDVWFAFEQSVNRNRDTLGATGEIVVRRQVGNTARREKAASIIFASGQLKGSVYYNSYGTALVRNYGGALNSPNGAFTGNQFGAATLSIAPGASTPSVVAGFAGSGGCRVCHSASADGKTLVTAREGEQDVYKYSLPPPNAQGTYFGGSGRFVFPAVNPNATRYFTNAGTHGGETWSTLYDGNGTAVAGGSKPSQLKAGYPVFSHDGRQVAFTFRGGSPSPLPGSAPETRALSIMSFDGNNAFSGFRTLHVPASGTAAWPSYLPAGQDGIVFQREIRQTPNGGFGFTRNDCDSTGTCHDQGATGELWWVTNGSTPSARRLDAANGWNADGTTGYLPTGGNRHGGPGSGTWYEQVYNFEPSVLPTLVGGYSWVAFTSRRLYGNVATVNPYWSDPRYRDISIEPTPKKIWVTAVAQNATPGSDPSAPAFYLPGQELSSGNSRAVFALDACRAPGPLGPNTLCNSDLDCCGAPLTSSCVLDQPIVSPPLRHCIALTGGCKADGEACTSDAQCCGFSDGKRCASGTCQLPPPLFSDASFTRDYYGSCPVGESVVWRLFEWQAATPVGTQIQFYAQTRDQNADPWLPAAPVEVGTAQAPPTQTTGWRNGGTTVDSALRTTGNFSRSWLRITSVLRASQDRARTPTLQQWRATFDCVAYE